jgi:AAA domain
MTDDESQLVKLYRRSWGLPNEPADIEAEFLERDRVAPGTIGNPADNVTDFPLIAKAAGPLNLDPETKANGHDDDAEPFGSPRSADPRAEEPPPASSPDIDRDYIFLGDTKAAPPRELIDGLIPAEGVAVTGGQSTAGKTFEEIHKAICLGTGIPYFGRKIVERVGTVFVAAEGRPLMPNRFAAALIKLSIEARLPITWPKLLPDFSRADGIKRFIHDLNAIDERYRGDFGVRLGHVPIDTVAATFGMKDEDDNAEATRVCNTLRSIGEETGVLMSPVHHYGKNPESGLRGASAWKGSADIILGVLADIDPLTGKTSNRELVCAKARDGEQGPISPFDLEFVPLGLKDDGTIYGSCCVVPKEGEKSRFDKKTTQHKSEVAILRAINEALDNGRAQNITPRAGMPEVKAAKVSDVRAEFDRFYVVDETDPTKVADAKRKAFRRALDKLPMSKFGAGSAEGFDWIWKIQ